MTNEITDLTRGVYRRLYGGFITGQRINKLTLSAEAWFWRVLVAVDDFGNGRADPDLCKAATAGSRKVTSRQVSGWLREMRDVGLIEFYTAKGEPLLHVVGFEANQPAGKNGKRFKRFLSPDESGGIQVNPELSSASQASDTDHNNDTDNKDMSRAAQARRVFQFWQDHLNHPKAVLDSKRQRAIESRLRDGYTEDQLLIAVKGCRLTPYNMGENREHRVYDDIELICRDAAHVDRFVTQVPSGNGAAKVVESPEGKQRRESCLRCFGTGTERTAKGARACKHEEVNDATGVIHSNSESVQGTSTNCSESVS